MMNMREMLGEAGRTMSQEDIINMMSNRQIRNILGESGKTISNMDRAIAAGMGSPMYDDNEPRFEDRSPENQMFSIDTAIGNLMTEYDMVVRNKEFERAQMIADQIDQLQQQKIGIQAQNVPQMRMGGMVPPKPSVESTDTRMTSFLRKYAITPHLMDVGFFQEPSFDKWVQATRSANKAGSPIPYVSPILSDSIDALKVGYDAFIEDLNKSRQKTEPQQDDISRILDSISE
jgi:hypothetical protein